ncbi:MAG: V-type ATPase subunit [Candidatus Micrarchaeota archaeon]|nr:V-type ATPase subunit [Candidatus Micrarchaeota archaeon]MDE1804600.1 V-type ATPase subunit [Candidatus Micrarchaeota archaeon]MDE1846950.1 V-type ATPase subunit [Candidatus Micrarchaeota archaeon]
MPVAGYSAAALYGYSTARVKAMESKLITKDLMQNIINSKSVESMVSLLAQTDYKKDLEEFGGKELKSDLIDFALSRNLASNVGKLITVTPIVQKGIIRSIVGKWDLYNVKLAIDAKERNMKFESISRYVIDYGLYNASVLKEVMNEPNVESMISRMMINSPYKNLLAGALENYRKERSAVDVNRTIDRMYYNQLGSIITKLLDMHYESATIIKADIDMRNLLLLIRSKRYSVKFEQIEPSIIQNGSMKPAQLRDLYEGAKDMESLVKEIKVFDLSAELDRYRQMKRKELLIFEIGMQNSIFNKSIKLLRHSVLSIGTIVAYAYMKEIEVFTLRILIKGKAYSLGQDELSRMIVWKAE